MSSEEMRHHYIDVKYHVGFTITTWYVAVVRRIAWRMVSHAKKMERANTRNVQAYMREVIASCM